VLAGAALALTAALTLACDESGHAPYGSSAGSPPPGGSDPPPTPDGGSDDDGGADTDDDGGPAGCAEDEIVEPGGDYCWLRCPVGQTWDGQFCSGSALALDWVDANAACATIGGGHHVPSRQQAIGILDNCEDLVLDDLEGFCDPCGASYACGEMFGYDVLAYWTSTEGPYAPWTVAFDSGLVFMSDTALDYHYTRCLRSPY